MRKMTVAALCLGVLFACCAPYEIDGDWILCKDDSCTELGENGIRFTDGGRWGLLEASEGTAGAPVYDLQLKARGRYDIDDGQIILWTDGESTPITLQMEMFENGDLRVKIPDIKPNVTCVSADAPPRIGGSSPTETNCNLAPSYPTNTTVRLRRVGNAGAVPVISGDDGDSVAVVPAPQ